MILAVTLFAIVSTSIYFSMRSGLVLYKRSEEGVREAHQINYFLREIDSELKHAFIYGGDSFIGKEKELQFNTVKKTYDKDDEYIDVVQVLYEIKAESLTRTTEYLSRTESSVTEKNILRGVIENCSFAYAYYDEEAEEIDWQDSWKSEEQEAVPKGVRIHFVANFYDKDADVVQSKRISKRILLPQGTWGDEDA